MLLECACDFQCCSRIIHKGNNHLVVYYLLQLTQIWRSQQHHENEHYLRCRTVFISATKDRTWCNVIIKTNTKYHSVKQSSCTRYTAIQRPNDSSKMCLRAQLMIGGKHNTRKENVIWRFPSSWNPCPIPFGTRNTFPGSWAEGCSCQQQLSHQAWYIMQLTSWHVGDNELDLIPHHGRKHVPWIHALPVVRTTTSDHCSTPRY